MEPISHPGLCKREAVANDAPAREAALANAADAPIDDATTDGWMKIAPYGTYPGSRPGRLQHFSQVEANAIVAEFRSLRGRAGRLFRGVPIYIGHPDQDPALYTDHRRLGKAIDLEARPDGLYGEVAWNALGEENQREGYWVYPSPRWDAPAGRPEFRPDRLISIGLTNTPRIATSEPVTNSEEVISHGSRVMSEEEERSSSSDSDSLSSPMTDDQSTNAPLMDRKLLTDKLGLDVTATDEEIMAALTSLLDSAAAAQAKQTEADSATAALATEKTEKEGIACSLTAANAKYVEIRMFGGGGGGGSGRRGLAGTLRCGGGGGCGCGMVEVRPTPVARFTWPLAYVVGAGGAGGAAQTVDSTDGVDGQVGGATTLGPFTTNTANKGVKGTAVYTSNAGLGLSGAIVSMGGLSNPISSGTGGMGGGTVQGANGTAMSGMVPSGGGGGGGVSATNVVWGGGLGGRIGMPTSYSIAAAAIGSNGAQDPVTLCGGGGGGGSQDPATAVGGAGGNAANYGGGGGGGSGSLNSLNSGKGGNGGNGAIIITFYY